MARNTKNINVIWFTTMMLVNVLVYTILAFSGQDSSNLIADAFTQDRGETAWNNVEQIFAGNAVNQLNGTIDANDVAKSGDATGFDFGLDSLLNFGKGVVFITQLIGIFMLGGIAVGTELAALGVAGIWVTIFATPLIITNVYYIVKIFAGARFGD